jgi:hypothetical protein
MIITTTLSIILVLVLGGVLMYAGIEDDNDYI